MSTGKTWRVGVLGTAALLAVMLLSGVLGLPGPTEQGAVGRVAAAAPSMLLLTGRVYEGDTGVEPPGSSPIQGVTVSLYCSNNLSLIHI